MFVHFKPIQQEQTNILNNFNDSKKYCKNHDLNEG